MTAMPRLSAGASAHAQALRGGHGSSESARLEEVPKDLVTEDMCLAGVQHDVRNLYDIPDCLKTVAVCEAAAASDCFDLMPPSCRRRCACPRHALLLSERKVTISGLCPNLR